MKKATIIFVSLLAIALTAGLVLTGCPQPAAGGGGGGGNVDITGTWVNTDADLMGTFVFDGSGTYTYTSTANTSLNNSGTYSVSGNTVTIKPTGASSQSGTVSGNTMTTPNNRKYTKQ